MGGLKTRHVTFTKVSDAGVSFSFILAERDGVPMFQRGAVPDEANQPGQRGKIVIPSAHHGSGQYAQRDPEMYDTADGWLGDQPGLLRVRGQATVLHSALATGQDCEAWGRGAVIPQVHDPAEIEYVTPDAIYLDATSKLTVTATTHFTGSHAKLGFSVYYGSILEGTSSEDTRLAQHAWLTSAEVWHMETDVANSGLFVASTGSKMWVLSYTAASQAWSLKWTDDFDGSDPLTFSASYSGFGRPLDMFTLGPHAMIVVQHLIDHSCDVISVNVDGFVQAILTGLPPIMFATPFLGGALLWHKGGLSATWMRDIGTFQHISWDALSQRSSRQSIPNMQQAGELSGTLERGNPAGIAATAVGHELYHSVYGKYSKADDTIGTGSTVLLSVFAEDGFHTHVLATPEIVTQLEDKFVMGMAVQYRPAADIDNEWSRRLILLLAEPKGGPPTWATADISVIAIELWDGTYPPTVTDTGLKSWASSWLHGDHYSLKQFRKLRFGGYTIESGAGKNLTWEVYVDGVMSTIVDTGTVDLSTGKTHTISLDDDVIGRTIKVRFISSATAGEAMTIEMPVEIDYFTVPELENAATLGILAGADQPDRAGGISPESRKTVIANVETIRDSQERWTMLLWDKTSWVVMPLNDQDVELEGEHVSGAGVAVVNLAVQRLT